MMRLEKTFAIVTGIGEALIRPHTIDLAQRSAQVAPNDRVVSNKEGVDACGDMNGFRYATAHNFFSWSGGLRDIKDARQRRSGVAEDRAIVRGEC
mgnify:CR=1 FL=1|tara:strand:+ start:415 stop:699 length:285 start_codon:yes stop_codon:yes gene_type:complete